MSGNTFTDRQQKKTTPNKTAKMIKNQVSEKEFSRTLDSEEEVEIEGIYTTTHANMESTQTKKGERILFNSSIHKITN